MRAIPQYWFRLYEIFLPIAEDLGAATAHTTREQIMTGHDTKECNVYFKVLLSQPRP